MNEKEPAILIKDAVLDFPFHNAGSTTFINQLLSLFNRENKNWFRALNGINIRIEKGEVVGLMGPNGSGKSTLIRLIAGIYNPDGGIVQCNGRIAILVSYGLGFSPNLPGRDNIYLSGGFLGLKYSELKELEEEIIEFSGLGEFIDAPIRTYSSGMRARLGFSIACHSNPDILLLDEVMSVGDNEFKRKSKNKVLEMVEGDTTVVIVSHNVKTLTELCDRLVYIEKGRVIVDNDDDLVKKLYHME